MEKDIGNEVPMDEKQVVPELMTSTIVNRSLLVKILRRLSYFLDQEVEHSEMALEYEEKFLEIIQILKAKQISNNEFFEEDQIVQDLLKLILKKILRNISVVTPVVFDVDAVYQKKKTQYLG